MRRPLPGRGPVRSVVTLLRGDKPSLDLRSVEYRMGAGEAVDLWVRQRREIVERIPAGVGSASSCRRPASPAGRRSGALRCGAGHPLAGRERRVKDGEGEAARFELRGELGGDEDALN